MLTGWHWWDQEDVDAGHKTNFIQVVQNTDTVELTSDGWRIKKRCTQGIGSLSALADAILPPALNAKATAQA